MSSINLKKGGVIDLKKQVPSLSRIRDLKCSDEQMMEQMIQPEFIQWVKQF